MNNNLYNDFKKIYLSGTENFILGKYFYDNDNILNIDILDKKTSEFRFFLKVKYDEKGEVIWY